MIEPIRVAIAGVGNCASALVQSVAYYTVNPADGAIAPMIGHFAPGAIRFVAAFDIDKRKVGVILSHAIRELPNCVPMTSSSSLLRNIGGNTEVNMGPVRDGIAPHMSGWPDDKAFRVSDAPMDDVIYRLRHAKAEVLVNYMPVGADSAARFYAECALEAGCGFINAMPCFIASKGDWAERFERAGLPLIGDDVKSQFGATYVHRALVAALHDRGCKLKRTYQLNTGGNTDFLNMLDRSRLVSKKVSKTRAVTSVMGIELAADDVHIGPADYVPWQGDNKIAFIRLEAEGCAGAPIELELRLSVRDSPNSAGVVIDAIRYAGMARRSAIGGTLDAVCAWLMKSPPRQLSDGLAKSLCAEIARGNLDAITHLA